MKFKLPLLFSIPFFLSIAGCGSGQAEPTAQQKKDFMGGPMPKDFMKAQQAGQAAAQKAAADAAAKNSR